LKPCGSFHSITITHLLDVKLVAFLNCSNLAEQKTSLSLHEVSHDLMRSRLLATEWGSISPELGTKPRLASWQHRKWRKMFFNRHFSLWI